MTVCSIEFLLLLLLASAVFHWMPNVRLRQAFLALGSAGFLYSLIPDAAAWMGLAVFVAFGYVVARLLETHPRRWILGLYVVALVGAFLVMKRYEFVLPFVPASVLAHPIAIVGLSYMLFRQIHVAVDSLQGQIGNLSLWTYLNYQLNLFGLLAGPIQRYQEFAEDWAKLEPFSIEWHDVLRAYLRLFTGVVKVVLLADTALRVYNWAAGSFEQPREMTAWHASANFLLVLYAYPAYMYFNFSGYCDAMIAAAGLFGIRMPENFDYPFLSRNMIDYWTRWHMTLGFWIRDYIFTPLYMTIASHWPARAASFAFLCYFLAFFLAGLWHGSTWNFVIYGLLNGLGVAAAKLWENWLVKRRGRRGFKTYLQSRSIHALAVIGTFHFVCFTLLFFPTDLEKTFRIIRCLVCSYAGQSVCSFLNGPT